MKTKLLLITLLVSFFAGCDKTQKEENNSSFEPVSTLLVKNGDFNDLPVWKSEIVSKSETQGGFIYPANITSPHSLGGKTEQFRNAYDPLFVSDHDQNTCWAADLKKTPSPTLSLFYSNPISADRIVLLIGAGLQKDESLFMQNASPALITLSLDHTIVGKIKLTRNLGMQRVIIPLSSPHTFKQISLKIDSAFSGEKYQDVCISELYVQSVSPQIPIKETAKFGFDSIRDKIIKLYPKPFLSPLYSPLHYLTYSKNQTPIMYFAWSDSFPGFKDTINSQTPSSIFIEQGDSIRKLIGDQLSSEETSLLKRFLMDPAEAKSAKFHRIEQFSPFKCLNGLSGKGDERKTIFDFQYLSTFKISNSESNDWELSIPKLPKEMGSFFGVYIEESPNILYETGEQDLYNTKITSRYLAKYKPDQVNSQYRLKNCFTRYFYDEKGRANIICRFCKENFNVDQPESIDIWKLGYPANENLANSAARIALISSFDYIPSKSYKVELSSFKYGAE